MPKIAKLGSILFAITAVTGLLLGAVQNITSGSIAAQRARQKNDALAATLPGAKNFTPVALKTDAGIIAEIFSGSGGGKTLGYNFTLTPKGFGGLMTLVCGIDAEGRVTDIAILESSETPGLGARASEPAFAGQFHGRLADGDLQVTKTPPENGDQIQAISGATITSRAVTDAVNAARAYWKNHLKKEEAK
ncbi:MULTISPECIES: RnfABCDGE type electron transport complex subunit G [unclassified Pyramidobacter]|uniref:RnfABCDGE type electron transport complex subunit G n=1 Tax=unclassified Pyramidobacter TaxID=2632171 RepID=UPI000EA0505A|nr:RnfABCDGE type electron transport complex subunit G [Pyramidobacter sp. CG50-2]RKJ79254.1 RnfABCDGE type electron transport complex subunit G [Pyramidobacter sp. CG50-2]